MIVDDDELIELVELPAATALHHSITMTVNVYVHQFAWSGEVASKVIELAGVAHQRGREMRLRRKRWRCPTVVLDTAGGAVGKELIRSHYRIGLNGSKPNGHPGLTVDTAIKTLQECTGRRLKENHRAHGADNSARGRARAYLVDWLKSHYWLGPYVDRYDFGRPLALAELRVGSGQVGA